MMMGFRFPELFSHIRPGQRRLPKFILSLSLVVLSILAPLPSGLAQEIPLPDDIKIEKPDEGLPPELKNLLGVWEGEWKWKQDSWHGDISNVKQRILLIVEKVQQQSAQIVWAWADCQYWEVSKGWRRYGASIFKVGNHFELTFIHISTSKKTKTPQRTYTFFINTKGRLEGKHTANLNAYTEMEKKEHFTLAALSKGLKTAKVDTLQTGSGSGKTNFAVTHKKEALTLAQKGQYDQALSQIDQALAMNPKDAETYTRRGGIYTLQKQYDKALENFNRAIDLDPRSAKAYYNRALVYYYQGKYDQALADLNKTIELKPKDAEAYHNRGLVYIQKNDHGKAIEDFTMAIALNPKLADAYFNKASTCERAGRREEAQEAYAAYLKVAPPEAKAQIEQARARVRE
jgi:tetratricopeptide (TPR) repeat protein